MKKTLIILATLCVVGLGGCKRSSDVTATAAASAASNAASAQKMVPAKYNPNLKPGNIVWADEATKKRFERIQAEAAARRAASGASQ